MSATARPAPPPLAPLSPAAWAQPPLSSSPWHSRPPRAVGMPASPLAGPRLSPLSPAIVTAAPRSGARARLFSETPPPIPATPALPAWAALPPYDPPPWSATPPLESPPPVAGATRSASDLRITAARAPIGSESGDGVDSPSIVTTGRAASGRRSRSGWSGWTSPSAAPTPTQGFRCIGSPLSPAPARNGQPLPHEKASARAISTRQARWDAWLDAQTQLAADLQAACALVARSLAAMEVARPTAADGDTAAVQAWADAVAAQAQVFAVCARAQRQAAALADRPDVPPPPATSTNPSTPVSLASPDEAGLAGALALAEGGPRRRPSVVVAAEASAARDPAMEHLRGLAALVAADVTAALDSRTHREYAHAALCRAVSAYVLEVDRVAPTACGPSPTAMGLRGLHHSSTADAGGQSAVADALRRLRQTLAAQDPAIVGEPSPALVERSVVSRRAREVGPSRLSAESPVDAGCFAHSLGVLFV